MSCYFKTSPEAQENEQTRLPKKSQTMKSASSSESARFFGESSFGVRFMMSSENAQDLIE